MMGSRRFLYLPSFLTLLAGPPAMAAPGGSSVCSAFKTAPEYCANFQATASLKGDPFAKKVAARCEAFYQEALAAAGIVCQYQAEAASVNAWGAPLGNQSDSQTGSVQSTAALNNSVRAIYNKYFGASTDEITKLKNAQRAFEKALTQMGDYGTGVLQSEVSCSQTGTPGAAEGAQLVGLAKLSLEWERESYGSVMDMLGLFNDQMWVNAGQTTDYGNKLDTLQGKLTGSTITGGGAGNDAVVANAAPTAPGYNPMDSAQGAMTDKVSDLTANAVRRLVITEAAVEGGAVAEEELKNRASSFLVAAAKEVVPGVALGGAVKLITSSKVDAITLTNVGIGAIASCAGVTAAPALALGVAVDAIEVLIRRSIAMADGKIVVPYLKSLKAIPNADSPAAAASYAQQKATLDYCKKCNHVDTLGLNYCPARNKYNPKWFDDSDHAGRPQTWQEPDPNRALPPSSSLGGFKP